MQHTKWVQLHLLTNSPFVVSESRESGARRGRSRIHTNSSKAIICSHPFDYGHKWPSLRANGQVVTKPGFSFIEIVVVLLILGLLAGIGIPALQNRLPGFQRKEFMTQFNALLNFAWQQALADQKVHQLHIDITKRTISIKAATEQKGRDGTPIFAPISSDYFATDYQWPESIQFKQFFVDGIDMMRGIKTEEMWFYVVPDGMVQPVIINLIDTAEEDARGEPVQFALVVNPFTARVTTYDSFQKP